MFVGLVPFKMQAGEAGLWSWWFVWRKKFEAKQTQFLSFSPSGCVISRAQTTGYEKWSSREKGGKPNTQEIKIQAWVLSLPIFPQLQRTGVKLTSTKLIK